METSSLIVAGSGSPVLTRGPQFGPGGSPVGSPGPQEPVCCWGSSGTPVSWILEPPLSTLPLRRLDRCLNALCGRDNAGVRSPTSAELSVMNRSCRKTCCSHFKVTISSILHIFMLNLQPFLRRAQHFQTCTEAATSAALH